MAGLEVINDAISTKMIKPNRGLIIFPIPFCRFRSPDTAPSACVSDVKFFASGNLDPGVPADQDCAEQFEIFPIPLQTAMQEEIAAIEKHIHRP
jgi:hypothetical protein